MDLEGRGEGCPVRLPRRIKESRRSLLHLPRVVSCIFHTQLFAGANLGLSVLSKDTTALGLKDHRPSGEQNTHPTT